MSTLRHCGNTEIHDGHNWDEPHTVDVYWCGGVHPGPDDLQTRYNNLWLELAAAAGRIATLEEALAPFAAMARPGDANGEQAAELVVQRGVASDMTVIKNRDWWRAHAALGETKI